MIARPDTGHRVRFATWNIGGGILGESHQVGGVPSLGHHVSVLREHAPDVVCLQETHVRPAHGQSQPEDLARLAGYPHVTTFPLSESHLASDAQLALAILSRFPVRVVAARTFPNPGLESTGPNGARWTLADKGYLTAVVDLVDRELGVVNAHCFPLHHFGASPLEPKFARMWEMLADDVTALGSARPVLAGMDLNHGSARAVLGSLLGLDGHRTAFENTATTPKGVQRDHVLYSSAARLLTTSVVATEGDHSYCEASFLV